MRRYLITCDCCLEDIGFDQGDNALRWGKLEYPDGRKRDLCANCFEAIEQIYRGAKEDYTARRSVEQK